MVQKSTTISDSLPDVFAFLLFFVFILFFIVFFHFFFRVFVVVIYAGMPVPVGREKGRKKAFSGGQIQGGGGGRTAEDGVDKRSDVARAFATDRRRGFFAKSVLPE